MIEKHDRNASQSQQNLDKQYITYFRTCPNVMICFTTSTTGSNSFLQWRCKYIIHIHIFYAETVEGKNESIYMFVTFDVDVAWLGTRGQCSVIVRNGLAPSHPCASHHLDRQHLRLLWPNSPHSEQRASLIPRPSLTPPTWLVAFE